MISAALKEVLDLTYEFILSLVAICGGGFLLYQGRATDVVISLMSVIITFWFSRRATNSMLNKQQATQTAADQMKATNQTPDQAAAQYLVNAIQAIVPQPVSSVPASVAQAPVQVVAPATVPPVGGGAA